MRIGLIGSLNQPVSELSGGMERRVAIVRAVLANSDVIFLDEPFKGLDVDTKDVMQYIKSNKQDRTVIMVTHSIDEVEFMNGNLIVMEQKAEG